MKNLVLIGMPGSGKTTVGTILARRLNLPLVDTDALVELGGRTIGEIFSADGEDTFRALETEAVRRAAARTGAVIATGGGVVLRRENMDLLARTGRIFFLDRPVEEIAAESHSARPLIGGERARVFQLYEMRIALYRAYGQHRIFGVTTPEEAADAILAIWAREENTK